ncbi:MAG: hypothetical protein SWH61_00255 [Thermodesulfobacteriota bacterium]|nr:hypothetical protein [Thermodesulfobacteriota bacterium]
MFFRKKKQKPQQPLEKQKSDGVAKSVLLAYTILLGHIGIIAILGLLVLLFGGIANYFLWLVFGGAAMVLGAAWFFLKKMKSEQDAIRRLIQLPEFKGKNIEISFLGGAASVKVGSSQPDTIDVKAIDTRKTLLPETDTRSRIKDLGELSRLYENNMITAAEFERLKKALLDADEDDSESGDNDNSPKADAIHLKRV